MGRRITPTWTVAAVMALGLAIAGCGGGGSGGSPGSKAGWESRHGADLASFTRDLEFTDSTLNRSDRTAILPACSQLKETVASLRKSALPVPDATADAALTKALDAAGTAADTCVAGARSGQANMVEAAMAQMTDARKALATAQAAIDAWS